MSYSEIIWTKINRPSLPGNYVHRQHINTMLHQGAKSPLTVVSAHTGYGKSSLVNYWLEAHKGRLGFFVSPVYYKGDADEDFSGLLGERRNLEVEEEAWLIDYGVGRDLGPWKVGENGNAPVLTLPPLPGSGIFTTL